MLSLSHTPFSLSLCQPILLHTKGIRLHLFLSVKFSRNPKSFWLFSCALFYFSSRTQFLCLGTFQAPQLLGILSSLVLTFRTKIKRRNPVSASTIIFLGVRKGLSVCNNALWSSVVTATKTVQHTEWTSTEMFIGLKYSRMHAIRRSSKTATSLFRSLYQTGTAEATSLDYALIRENDEGEAVGRAAEWTNNARGSRETKGRRENHFITWSWRPVYLLGAILLTGRLPCDSQSNCAMSAGAVHGCHTAHDRLSRGSPQIPSPFPPLR